MINGRNVHGGRKDQCRMQGGMQVTSVLSQDRKIERHSRHRARPGSQSQAGCSCRRTLQDGYALLKVLEGQMRMNIGSEHTSVGAMEVTRPRDVVFRVCWYSFPYESIQVEHIEVRHHSALSHQSSSLSRHENDSSCARSARLTKRYIFEPTTVVDAPCESVSIREIYG